MGDTMRENLQRLIDERGVSVNELARRIGVRSDTTIGRWLKGSGEPRISEAVALARFFGVGLFDLLGDDAGETVERLSPYETEVLELLRTMLAAGLSPDEAKQRLLGVPAGMIRLAPDRPAKGHGSA